MSGGLLYFYNKRKTLKKQPATLTIKHYICIYTDSRAAGKIITVIGGNFCQLLNKPLHVYHSCYMYFVTYHISYHLAGG